MINEKNIPKLIIFIPIFFILIIIASTSYLNISILTSHFEKDITRSSEHQLSLKKQLIKNQIDSVYEYIEHKKSISQIRLKEKLKTRVNTAHKFALEIFNEKKNLLSKDDLQKEILKSINKIRYEKDDYYFIVDMKSDKELIAKIPPRSINNSNVYSLKDLDGKYFIQEFANIVKTKKEGFFNYKINKLDDDIEHKKVSFVKLFSPYNWYIGYGEYLDDFNENIKFEAKRRLNLIKFATNGYIWTHDTNHNLIQHPYRKDFIGTDDSSLVDKKGTKIIQQFVEKALSEEKGSFIEYYWNKPNEIKLTKKIGYVRHIKDWNWVIGAGLYVEDIEVIISRLKKEKKENSLETTTSLISFFIIVLLLTVILSFIISKKVRESFINYKNKINKQNNELSNMNLKLEEKVELKVKELKELNEQLENRITKRVEEVKEKDIQLIQQSKMVAMGEMIGNIAHQWRQPLSMISTSATGMIMQKKYDVLTDEMLTKSCNNINDNAQYLSKTIDDFRNFIEGDRTKKYFYLKDDINSFLHLVEGNIKSNNINIVLNIDEDIQINGYPNELIQCLMNIVNNSKDGLIENDIKERLIFISTSIKNDQAIIVIKDNATGIPKDVLPKIFEPYFTTKHKSQGTGLGLHMTYNLIVDGMKGSIEAKNITFEYDGNEYKGAEFIISLPK